MNLILKALFALAVAVLVAAPLGMFPTAHAAGLHVSAPRTAPSHGSAVVSCLAAAAAVGMAIRIKDTGSLAKKFVRNASAAGGDYAEGVKQAGGDWESATKASGDNWAAGVQQAIGDKRFEKGVSEAGASKYVERASTLGANRYPQGVAVAEGAWAKGAQPHLDAMKSLDLPPRRPKGDPANQNRAAIVASRNRAIKLGK